MSVCTYTMRFPLCWCVHPLVNPMFSFFSLGFSNRFVFLQ
nr:hypothetical protein Q903MT_gene2189 [Picea sitchensis]